MELPDELQLEFDELSYDERQQIIRFCLMLENHGVQNAVVFGATNDSVSAATDHTIVRTAISDVLTATATKGEKVENLPGIVDAAMSAELLRSLISGQRLTPNGFRAHFLISKELSEKLGKMLAKRLYVASE